MVQRRINVVDANGVHLKSLASAHVAVHSTYTQLLHHNSIAQTHVPIGESIFARGWLVSGLTSRLVVNTNDHQPLVRDGIDKILAADLDRVDGVSNAGEQGGEQCERTNQLSGR